MPCPSIQGRTLRIICCWLVLASGAAAQPSLFSPQQRERIQEGLKAVYSLEHDQAVKIYQTMVRQYPDDAVGYTYLAKTYWLQELVTKQELSIDRFAASDFFAESPKYKPKVDPAVEARFRHANETAIEKARARLKEDPDDRAAAFLLGLAYQNLASFEASLKRSWWASFRAGSKTYRYHRKLLRQDPSFYDAYLSTGVFHYVTGRLGWNVKWLAFLLGYRGSTTRGKQELNQAADKGTLAGDDARVVLTLIYTREEDFQNAFDQLSLLLKKYPKNYLVHLDMGGIALLMERYEAALLIYRDVLRKVTNREPKYVELEKATVSNRMGVALRQKGDFEHSVEWFRRALNESDQTQLSAVVSHLELGKTYDRMGLRTEASREYNTVLRLDDYAGSRLEADMLLEKRYHREKR